MTASISNRQRTKKINVRLLKLIVNELFTELKIKEGELGINFVVARKMAEVNRQFLQHEGSTDVITFNYSDETVGTILSGELFVCVDEAILQAGQFKTSWQSEVVRYIVHGVLHLRGYDDLKLDLRRKMKREENRLLRKLSKKFSLAQIGGGSKLRA